MQRCAAQLQKTTRVLHDEDGVAIVAVMLILVLITIIGIASTNVSHTEVTIAGNQAVYQRTFYRAEGATIEAIDLLEGLLNPDTSTATWLENDLNQITAADIEDPSFWNSGGYGTTPATSTLSDTQYLVVSEGIVAGSSLGVASSKVHEYGVYGRCASAKGGTTVVNIGYLMAF